jgi:hypothetical protein
MLKYYIRTIRREQFLIQVYTANESQNMDYFEKDATPVESIPWGLPTDIVIEEPRRATPVEEALIATRGGSDR